MNFRIYVIIYAVSTRQQLKRELNSDVIKYLATSLPSYWKAETDIFKLSHSSLQRSSPTARHKRTASLGIHLSPSAEQGHSPLSPRTADSKLTTILFLLPDHGRGTSSLTYEATKRSKRDAYTHSVIHRNR